MKCIDPWLTKNRRVCPVCKAKVTFPGMEKYSDTDSDSEQRRQSSTNETATETSRLLGSSARNNSHTSRNLRYLSLMIGNSSINNSTRSNQTSNTTSYDLLDDSLIQPGPSTSAPIVSELSSNNNRNLGRRTRKKRNNRNTSNVQVVVADVSPLIAPPQLSINGDFEPERPNTRTLSMRLNPEHTTHGSNIV